MRRNMKKLCCAILCLCLLLMNTPGSLSYAENMEQNASETDADTDATTEDVDVPETEVIAQATISADVEDIDAESATETDAVLYAASEDESGGAYIYVIKEQADWDKLFIYNQLCDSAWMGSLNDPKKKGTLYVREQNPVEISLTENITLDCDTTISIKPFGTEIMDFRLYGDGEHSINLNGHTLTIEQANIVTIDNIKFINGMVNVSTPSSSNKISITKCNFESCSGPCVNSSSATPVSFSNCTMNNCGLLFDSSEQCHVSFSGITAENCTGTVLGPTSGNSYIIDSISNCKLSTQTPGLTAIKHETSAVGEITDCTISGFDKGIELKDCYASSSSGINTLIINKITIEDCIIGVDIYNLQNYQNAIISELNMEARKNVPDDVVTVGYKGENNFMSKTFESVNFDFDQMPRIEACTIKGFDTGIALKQCPVVIRNCEEISDCKDGIIAENYPIAIVNTTLTARDTTDITTGVTVVSAPSYLIDCNINDFYNGSNMRNASNTTIIGCTYKNKHNNLICAEKTSVYDTTFIGGETSVDISSNPSNPSNANSYFYNCVVKGVDGTTTSGFELKNGVRVYIYSLARPYDSPDNGCYDELKNYSNNKNNGSEISHCDKGIDSASALYIADTYIHDCKTGINSTAPTYSFGNNKIEDCYDGMILRFLYKYITKGDAAEDWEPSDLKKPHFTDDCVDTICNCDNDGLKITSYGSISSNPSAPGKWSNRLKIYECGNNGINFEGSSINATVVEVYNCNTGIFLNGSASASTVLDGESMVYNNKKWNIYNNLSGTSQNLNCYGTNITFKDGGTPTDGESGNIYSKRPVSIGPITLHSDDSVYYLGTDDVTFKVNANEVDGTMVFDTVEGGYYDDRKVAELSLDITSQMFAKQAGWVITYKEEGNKKYAVFAEGYDVTYDVTTNGGDTFIDEDNDEEIKNGKSKRISYLKGDTVNLSYKASKPGYTFVGWNTDEDATEGLEPDTLKAETADITLYAIYEKAVNINYHTYDATKDYTAAVTLYNKQDEIELPAYKYDDNTFAGYVLDEDVTVSSDADLLKPGDKITVSLDNLLRAGDTVTVSADGLDVYCVYEKQGQLKYLKKDGTALSTEGKTVYEIGSDNKEFVYTVRAGEPVSGFTFTGWKDAAGNSYAAGATLSTENNLIVLTPVYVENEEPTPEKPTPEVPTPEVPTPETPTPEVPTPETPTPEVPNPEVPTPETPNPETPVPGDPVIQPPTTEASTTQAPAGPKTGDSTNPIGVIGLGILSLLGILVLTMKKKRKN